MSLLESVKKTLFRTTKKVAKTSGEIVEHTKLKIKEIDIKDEINTRYARIGELYFGVAEYDQDNAEEINAVMEEIKAYKEKLDEIESERSMMKK
ncbi:MAG: hypothetical protein IKB50_00120 [Clostridia bacterium]|nr:hypothetical protein [Clostridia bacterium]